jgi:hypothetical protein
MTREDTDVRDDDNIDQMNYCWTEQNMVGEDTDVWRVNSVVKVRMTSSHKL